MLNLNQAESMRDFGQLIPDGSFVRLRGIIRPGGNAIPESPSDGGLFKLANLPSDAIMLDWEFVVVVGPHARSKLWQLMTVKGGKVNDKGQSIAANISQSMLRNMIESALAIRPDDTSPEAQQRRQLPNFSALNGIEFAARIGIEAGGQNAQTGGQYADKNKIAYVLTPADAEYAAVMAGQDVPPKPSGVTTPRQPAAQGGQQRMQWQQDAAPAVAQPGASPAGAWAPQQPAAGPAAAPPPASIAPAMGQLAQPQQPAWPAPQGQAPAAMPPQQPAPSGGPAWAQ